MSFQPPELRFFHQNDSDSKVENSTSAENDRFLSTEKPKGDSQQAVFNRDSGQITSQTRWLVHANVVEVVVVIVVVSVIGIVGVFVVFVIFDVVFYDFLLFSINLKT
jgi:hypothetical protein